MKASVDGYLDAGGLPDDSPEYINEIVMSSPEMGAESDGLVVVFESIDS